MARFERWDFGGLDIDWDAAERAIRGRGVMPLPDDIDRIIERRLAEELRPLAEARGNAAPPPTAEQIVEMARALELPAALPPLAENTRMIMNMNTPGMGANNWPWTNVPAVPVPLRHTPEELAQAIPLPPLPPARPQTRIRVVVERDQSGHGPWRFALEVNGQGIDLPRLTMMSRFLPKVRLGRMRRWESPFSYWCGILDEGRLTPQQLHDGFRAYLIAYHTEQASVESEEVVDDETRYLLNSQPATLEIGGRVFRLMPAGQKDVRPLIKRVREKALRAALGEAEAVKVRAGLEARGIVTHAQEQAQHVRRELEEERRNLRSGSIPGFLNDCPYAFMRTGVGDSIWRVLLPLNPKLREIRFTVREWRLVLYWHPLPPVRPLQPFHVWLSIAADGSCDYGRVSAMDSITTHIVNRACMHLDNVPNRVRGTSDLNLIREHLNRGIAQLNMNSPLSSELGQYHPGYLEQIPKFVQGWFMGSNSIAPRVTRTNEDGASVWETVEQWKARMFPTPEFAAGYTPWDWSETTEEEAATTFGRAQE